MKTAIIPFCQLVKNKDKGWNPHYWTEVAENTEQGDFAKAVITTDRERAKRISRVRRWRRRAQALRVKARELEKSLG